MRSNRSSLSLLVFLSLALALISSAAAAQNPSAAAVFRIGVFDRSSGEFAPSNPPGAVNFVAGQSNAAKDWFAAQPVILASAIGSPNANPLAAPRAISFSIPTAPAAAYRFHLAVLIEGPSVPVLHLAINGKTGAFYLHPKLDYSGGDQFDAFSPIYSAADVDFVFPGSFLHTGANTVALQWVEEASQQVPDAAINYDAIELTLAPAANPHAEQAQLEPTIYFQRSGNSLQETVEAFIRTAQPIDPQATAELSLAGHRYRAGLTAGQSFGDARFQFLVDEFPPNSQASLIVRNHGRQQTFTQTIDPKKKWTLYLVPHIHLDVGFSDYQAKVAAIHARVLDEAMQIGDEHPDFRFSLDGSWDIDQFMKTRSAADRARLVAAIQKQQIFVPAQYASLLTGISTTETLIRSLYPSANFSREHGTPFNYANITDVPSYSWSYASILASAGIPYLVAGSDNYRAPVLLQGRLNEQSPMEWIGPDGKKVVLWYSRIYQQMQMIFGLPPVLSAGRETLPLFLQMYEGSQYRADSTILFGTQVENTDLFPQQAELAAKWNSSYAYPHMQYAGFHEALTAIQKQFGDKLPTIRGDGAPYWEDGAAADAASLARERWTEARAQSAEKLATLASIANPLLKPDTAELGRMWRNIVLMDEHTFDSYNSVSDVTSREAIDQLAIKQQYAVNAAAQADFLTRRSMEDLAYQIPAGTGSLIVFNSLNWQRSGPVTFDLDKGQEIFDLASGQAVPVEFVAGGAGFNRFRFQATDVPGLGYKVYGTRATPKQPPAAQSAQSTTFENRFYKVELDPDTGSIRGIYDKQLHRELVSQQSPYRFGQYLYVTGGDKAPNTILHYDQVSPRPNLTIHPAEKGKLVSIVQTPTGPVATLESQAFNTPSIRTQLRLFDNEKKIELVESIDKPEVETKEAVYFAFPFAMSAPQFQYEIQTGVVDPAKDLYAGAGHEWFSAQHWVSVRQNGVSATVLPLDAPLITLGDINRGAWPTQFGSRPGTIFSYVMNNYWDTNYRGGQGGHFTFHYLITSAPATDPVDLSRLGWEEITPLEADILTTQDKALLQPPPNAPSNSAGLASEAAARNPNTILNGKQDGLLQIDDPGVLLETFKPAEDGNGDILRFADFAGTERTITVRAPLLHLKAVIPTDAVERDRPGSLLDSGTQFHFTLHPHEIATVRLVQETK